MANIFNLLTVLALVRLIIGLVNPKAFSKEGEQQTRWEIFTMYGSATIIFFLLYLASI